MYELDGFARAVSRIALADETFKSTVEAHIGGGSATYKFPDGKEVYFHDTDTSILCEVTARRAV
jgi:hypothetical protein